MKTQPLNNAEKAWLKKLEDVLMNPPSERIGFYTIGDADLSVYDRARDDEILAHCDDRNCDYGDAVRALEAEFTFIRSACQIHAVRG